MAQVFPVMVITIFRTDTGYLAVETTDPEILDFSVSGATEAAALHAMAAELQQMDEDDEREAADPAFQAMILQSLQEPPTRTLTQEPAL